MTDMLNRPVEAVELESQGAIGPSFFTPETTVDPVKVEQGKQLTCQIEATDHMAFGTFTLGETIYLVSNHGKNGQDRRVLFQLYDDAWVALGEQFPEAADWPQAGPEHYAQLVCDWELSKQKGGENGN